MINSKIILAPVDFSECSFKNLQNAVDLAKTFKAKLIILHVLPDKEQYTKLCNVSSDVDDMDKIAEENARKKMEEFENNIPEIKYIEREFKIRKGIAYSEILKEIKESSVSTLVIGAKGLSNLDDFIYGSVTEKVIKKSPVTTVITRKNTD